MLARSFLIESSSKLLVTRIRIQARTSSISGRIRLLTLELLALEWQKFYTFELEYLWGQLTNLDKILCVALLGEGKGCIIFRGRLDQNSGVHGNRKPPLTYNEENDVSTFSRLLLIRSFLYLLVTRTCIKSRTSSNFGQIGPLTMELAALEHLKISHRLIMGKWCLNASSFIFDRIIIKVAGNQDGHKSSVKFDFGPNQSTHFGVTFPWVTNISHFWTWISLKPVGECWSNFMCNIICIGERLHKVLGQIDFGTLDSGERSLPFGLLVSEFEPRQILDQSQMSFNNLMGYIFSIPMCMQNFITIFHSVQEIGPFSPFQNLELGKTSTDEKWHFTISWASSYQYQCLRRRLSKYSTQFKR